MFIKAEEHIESKEERLKQLIEFYRSELESHKLNKDWVMPIEEIRLELPACIASLYDLQWDTDQGVYLDQYNNIIFPLEDYEPHWEGTE